MQAEPKEQGRQKLDNQFDKAGGLIIVVKLLRTDTTLDLSQKARVVRNQHVALRYLYDSACARANLRETSREMIAIEIGT